MTHIHIYYLSCWLTKSLICECYNPQLVMISYTSVSQHGVVTSLDAWIHDVGVSPTWSHYIEFWSMLPVYLEATWHYSAIQLKLINTRDHGQIPSCCQIFGVHCILTRRIHIKSSLRFPDHEVLCTLLSNWSLNLVFYANHFNFKQRVFYRNVISSYFNMCACVRAITKRVFCIFSATEGNAGLLT